MKMIALVLSLTLFLLTFELAASISNFIDFYSFAFVLSMITISVLSCHGSKVMFGKTECLNDVLTTVIHTSILAGAVGLVIGVVAILVNLEDTSSVGPALAVAFLPLLYGLCASFLAYISMD